ncbi:MAG: class I SAM-dependent methyltransferase [Treponema sp.]|nr:class I SAM-dependent methyltransferase [Treponema sp.]
MEDKTALQAKMLLNRLQKRFRHLKKWAHAGASTEAAAQKSGIGAFRLYDRDIPEIPLVIDFYGDCAKLNEAALCGALYKRPYEKDEAEEAHWLSVMKESIGSAIGINPEFIFFKQRQKQKSGSKSKSQYEKIKEERFEKVVTEGGLFFKVNLSDYLDTGLFADRRLLRAMIRSQASGKKVLNLFSYTGSFSVYAAIGGAVSTDSVDLSNTYLDWARENFEINGMKANLVKYYDDFFGRVSQVSNTLLKADVLDFLDRAINSKKRWDIIILDPPAFSNSKKMTDTFDLSRDLPELVKKCLKLLTPGGKIYVSINLRRAAPSAEELETKIGKIKITDLTNSLISEDFKGKKTPKTFLVTLK